MSYYIFNSLLSFFSYDLACTYGFLICFSFFPPISPLSQFSVTIIQAAPIILKTFRTELIWEQVPFTTPTHHTNTLSLSNNNTNTSNETTYHTHTTNDYQSSTTNHSKAFSKSSSDRQYSTVIDVNMDSAIIEENPLLKLSGTTLSFTEVKASRRSSFANSSPSTIFDMPSVLDAQNGVQVTFAEAIRRKIIRIKTLKYFHTSSSKEYSLEEAVSRSFIDKQFFNSINEYYGICDPKYKSKITLLQAIQRNFFNPITGSFIQPKNGIDISVEPAVDLGMVDKTKIVHLIEKNILSCMRYTIPEAIIKGYLDPDSGIFTSPHSKKNLSIPEAYALGYLCAATPIIEDSYSLTEALNLGLVLDGKVMDPDSGRLYPIDQALNHGILSKRLREVIDPGIGNIVSLPEGIDYKLIDVSSGRYVHPITGQELSLREAHQQKLLLPSLTLKHAFENELIDEDGSVTNILNSTKVSLIRAAVIGVVSLDVKCVVCPDEDKILTLAEALVLGIVTPDCKFVDSTSNERLGISQAANRGYLASVDRRMIFDIEGFRDTKTGEYVSFNTAIERDIVDIKTGRVQDLNGRSHMTMTEALNCKLVIPQVYEMLDRPIGILDNGGTELTLLDSVIREKIDPQTGYLLEPDSKRPIRLMEAVERNLITEDGAIMLKSLLNITVTLTSITKTTTRYVTVASQSLSSDLRMTFDEAYRQGLIDEGRRTFRDPNTGNVMSIEEAISQGYLSILSTSSTEAHVKQSEITVFKNNMQFNNSYSVEIQDGSSMNEFSLERNKESLNVEQVDHCLVQSRAASLGKVEMELPDLNMPHDTLPKGLFEKHEDWESISTQGNTAKETSKSQFSSSMQSKPLGANLKDLLNEGVFDIETGHLKVSETGKIVNMEESINQNLLNPASAFVVNYHTKEMLTLDFAIKENLISSTGEYLIPGNKISMKEALNRNFIIFSDDANGALVSTHNVSSSENRSIIFNKLVSSTRIEKTDIGVETNESRVSEWVSQVKSSFENNSDHEHMETAEVFAEELMDTSVNEAVPQKTIIPVGPSEFTINFELQKVPEFFVSEGENALGTSENNVESVVTVNSPNVQTAPQTKANGHVQNENAKEEDTEKPTDFEMFDDGENVKKSIKAQYSVPRFEVTIGRAQMADPAKAVVLKKVKRKKVSPKYAAEKGIIDQETVDTLKDVEKLVGSDGKPVSLEEAVKLSLIDGNNGAIKNLKNNETLSINQAISDGILDPESGQFILPVGRSLSIPEAVNQGLVEPNQQKIVHPEHGEHLSIQEAIVCEIIDPMSKLTELSTGKNLTLESAIEFGVVNGFSGEVQTFDGKVSMLEAVKQNLFENISSVQIDLPLLAVTFPVALRHGYINLKTKSYVHPITGKSTSILEAVKQGLIMSSSADKSDQAILLFTALEENLIDSVGFTLFHPISKQYIPIDEAIESGIMIISSDTALPIKDIMKPKPNSVYILGDVIEKDLIEIGDYFVFNQQNERLPLLDVLSDNTFSLQAVVKILNEHEMVILADSANKYFNINPMNIDIAVSHGYYNDSRKNFLDAKSKSEITFNELVNQRFSEFSHCTVKHQHSLEYIPLKDAISQGILDRNNGNMIDFESGNLLTCFEAANKLLILYLPEENISQSKTSGPFTLKEAIEMNILDLDSLLIKLADSNQCLPLNEAVCIGAVEGSSILVYNPQKDELAALADAIEMGLIDCQRGIYIHPVTGQELFWKDAFKRGFIVPKQNSVSLEAAINLGMVNSETGLILDTVTRHEDNVEISVRKGVIDSAISLIKDAKTDTLLTLDEALQKRIVSKSGKVKNTLDGKWLNWDEALNAGLIKTLEMKFSFTDAIQEYYNVQSGQFFNPRIGQNLSLRQAIETQFLDSLSAKARSIEHNELITLEESISMGLIDDVKGVYIPNSLNLKESLQKGLIINCNLPLTLSEALELDMYNSENGKFEISQEEKNLKDLIRENVIDETAKTVYDANFKEILPLSTAVENGAILPDKGTYKIPNSDQEINLHHAYDLGLVLPTKCKFTLSEVVSKAFYNSKTMTYFDISSQTNMDFAVALKENRIDTSRTIFCDQKDKKVYSFDSAIQQNFIDISNGSLLDTETNIHIDLQEAFDRKILREFTCFSLKETITAGVYEEDSGLFFNPLTAEHLTLREGIKNNLINPNSVCVRDGASEISLAKAIENQKVDDTKGIVHASDGTMVSFSKAFELGYLVDSSLTPSLQHAIKNNLYENQNGKFLFNNEHRTLRDCLKNNFINGSHPCYWDNKSLRLLSLNETVRKGVIDSYSGKFCDDPKGNSIPLDDALKNGNLIDTDKSLTLYDALKLGLVTSKGKVKNPGDGFEITLRSACKKDVISSKLSMVKAPDGSIISLDKAVAIEVVDDIFGTYILQNEGIVISLKDAFQQGLIVQYSKPFTIEHALNMRLFDSDTGQFLDPTSGEMFSIQEAVAMGLIKNNNVAVYDKSSETLKSLELAMSDGTLDVRSGKVKNSSGSYKLSLDQAFEQHVILISEQGFLDEFSNNPFNDSNSPFQYACTMQEALDTTMIDSKSYFIKDTKTSNWVSLEEASEKGFLNLRKKVIFCQISKRKDLFVIRYDDQQVCNKKPSAMSEVIKEKCLNVLSGRFTDSSSKQTFTLKQAVELGFIDSGSAIVKDSRENRFFPLDQAFENHTLDPEKGIVVNTLTNQVLTLKGALDNGLLRTSPCTFSLIEALDYGMYDKDTHLIQNPFSGQYDTLEGAISSGLVDPTLTLIKALPSGNFYSVSDAIQKGILCPQTGCLKSDSSTTLWEAYRQGLLVPSEKRVRLFCHDRAQIKKLLGLPSATCLVHVLLRVLHVNIHILVVKLIIHVFIQKETFDIDFPMNTFYSKKVITCFVSFFHSCILCLHAVSYDSPTIFVLKLGFELC